MSAPLFQPITPHIFRLELRWWGFSVCVWLVQNKDEWSLIDTGPPHCAPLLFAALDQLEVVPTRLILTHGHIDHVGALSEIVARFGVEVWCHPWEAPYISGAARYGAIRPARWSYRFLARLVPTLQFPDLSVNLLSEGDQCGGLEVIHVPGHAPGHIALLHSGDAALLAADVFRFKPWSAMPIWTYDAQEARRSMRKLAAREFRHLLPSHGAPILESGKERAQKAA